MSDTPRTDATNWLINGTEFLVQREFARTLERELAAAKEENEKLRAARRGVSPRERNLEGIIRMKSRKPKISLPIDYNRLSECFIQARWSHWDGFPTPQKLQSILDAGFKDLEVRRCNPYSCYHTGGIFMQYEDEEITVRLHEKLARHYLTEGPTS